MNDKDDMFAPEVDEQDEFGGLDTEMAVKQPEKEVVEPVKPPAESQTPNPTPEGQIEAPKPVRKPRKAGTGKRGGKAAPKKRKTLTKAQKAWRLILRRSGKEEFPSLDDLMDGKNGKKVVINEIGIFAGTPKDPLIAELAADCMVGNTLNFSAEITKLRTLQVGTQIVKAGRMHTPIHIAKIKENGSLQCVSGLHRLAFLILVYGADSEIPVYLEEMTLEEARDAMGVANDSRPAKAKERAELAVLKALKGKSNVNQDELYMQMATNKSNARKYCIYSIVERGYPEKLCFKTSATSSRKDGGMTTLSNVETFLSEALDWYPELTRTDYDKLLKGCVEFLNALAVSFQKNANFNPDHHMTTKPMTAIGKYYYETAFAKKEDPMTIVDKVADKVVKMGDVSRWNPDEIFNLLTGV
jgi:hypothetical protein